MKENSADTVQLRLHLASPPAKVYRALATDAGRASFWADRAEERAGVVHFVFSNGLEYAGKILAQQPVARFAVEYFGGSRAEFELEPDGGGGTFVTLTESSIPEEWYPDQRAGWVTVLLTLKGAVDFGVDLRNPHPDLDWEQGFVDV